MNKIIALCAGMLLLLPMFATAAGMATVAGNGRTGHVYWQNGTLVLRQPDNARLSGIMVTGGHVYFIHPPGSTPRVVGMSGMMGMLQSMTGRAGRLPGDYLGRITAVEFTGDTETVAGIKGRVYRITMVRDGGSRTWRVVLTDHPVVVELTRLVINRARTLFGKRGAVIARYSAALPDAYGGILKFGNRFRLTGINGGNPADKWFRLPADPVPFARAMFLKMIR